MRVLVLTESFPTSANPSRSVFIREQVEALSREHTVTVLFPRPALPGLPTSRLEGRASVMDNSAIGQWRTTVDVKCPKYLYVPRHRGIRARQLAKIVHRTLLSTKEPYDIVHAHWLAPAGVAAVKGANGLNIPVVVTAHAGDVYRDINHAQHARVATQVVRQASRIIGVAEYFREPLCQLCLTPDKISVIPNGVDIGIFTPAGREEARTELKLPAGVPLYLYIGDLVKGKGVADVVDAFFAYAPPAAVLVVAGSGPLWMQFAQRVALADGRFILRGLQSHDMVARYLTAADCFVLPSYAEGNPVTVLESLCCGRPVIGSSIPAIAPLIEEGKSGLLVPPGNTAALGQAMRILPAMNWDAAAIARQAAGRYGWPTVAARISEVYAQAVAEMRAGLSVSVPATPAP
ncbi:MAG TPA: glycosyltransferase [Gammaproteobacteria bacterium]|nr:glycosyltransferase [Gammaproteobacteria bacterium]